MLSLPFHESFPDPTSLEIHSIVIYVLSCLIFWTMNDSILSNSSLYTMVTNTGYQSG